MKNYIVYLTILFLSALFVPALASADEVRCLDFNTRMYLGQRDFIPSGSVTQLQDFLIDQGYLRARATGYFGPLTFRAVRDFQISNGISGVGFVGPSTRSRIRFLTCQTVVTRPLSIYSISPTSGVVGSTVTLYGSGFTNDNTILFGGGAVPHVYAQNSAMLTFTVPSTLAPACTFSNPPCMMQQVPVMLTQPGNYPVSVSNQNGTSNSLNFTVVATGQGVTPVIQGVDSPTTLTVGQTGTWTVRATDPEGRGLSYSVLWGDERYFTTSAMSAQSSAFVQSATFTHVYNTPGVYTATFTVRGQNGQTAQTSVSVRVVDTSSVSPRITSVSPSQTTFGSTVTIYGSGFTRYNNSINFAGRSNVSVNIPSYDGTSLQFTVPYTPCSSGMICPQVVLDYGTYPLSVTNQNGTSNSVQLTVVPPIQYDPVYVSARINQTVSVSSNVDLTPLEIVEDSRCPIDVYCIQSGRVVVRTRVRSGDALQIINIGTDQTVTAVDGYRIVINSVEPVRRQGVTIGVNEYLITYRVSR